MTRTMVREVEYVEWAHDRLGLTYSEIARVLGADESTVHRWRAGESEPSPVYRRQLAALHELLSELDRAFGTAEAAREWLARPVPFLRGRRPVDLLLEGRITQVAGALFGLNAGILG